ncbi:hypothetical protein GTA08_BOTSDO09432 [Neofusicoccum parvum]|uniref:Uncharacterized protein n=1 Tax=Neofusicoccum parvum TaxID=310453 RepID=A0ACB5S344_9PEZI|nr:hypothetical protein GTA08_BOTSDO09432 [Neofusicoccum parvum]
MPPILHPRSRQTVSLFSATLLASFFVVGLPHVLPCPVNPRAAADSADNFGEDQMAARQVAAGDEPPVGTAATAAAGCNSEEIDEAFGRRRECPVPKPGGLVGQILGFEGQERVRRTVIVESVRAKRTGQTKEDGES